MTHMPTTVGPPVGLPVTTVRELATTGGIQGGGDLSINRTFSLIESAKSYGAVGDGATDDTTALQLAIDSVKASECVLHIPAGTYKITAALSLPSGLTIEGAGRGATTI